MVIVPAVNHPWFFSFLLSSAFLHQLGFHCAPLAFSMTCKEFLSSHSWHLKCMAKNLRGVIWCSLLLLDCSHTVLVFTRTCHFSFQPDHRRLNRGSGRMQQQRLLLLLLPRLMARRQPQHRLLQLQAQLATNHKQPMLRLHLAGRCRPGLGNLPRVGERNDGAYLCGQAAFSKMFSQLTDWVVPAFHWQEASFFLKS